MVRRSVMTTGFLAVLLVFVTHLAQAGIKEFNAAMAEGDYAEALSRFEAYSSPTPLHQVYQAAALAGLKENERSLLLLERAAKGGYGDADFLEATPWFDGLREAPRFKAVLEKVRAHQARAAAG